MDSFIFQKSKSLKLDFSVLMVLCMDNVETSGVSFFQAAVSRDIFHSCCTCLKWLVWHRYEVQFCAGHPYSHPFKKLSEAAACIAPLLTYTNPRVRLHCINSPGPGRCHLFYLDPGPIFSPSTVLIDNSAYASNSTHKNPPNEPFPWILLTP
jgi:hypothetical protein